MVELAAQYKKKIIDWKQRNLFVRNLHDEINEERLKMIFADFGDVESVRINYNNAVYFESSSSIPQTKKESKGSGFICFKSNE